ncbi:MAG TPA: response regulator [Candidatus Thermoplasmatota archaeon]|nr:response regulator [Candidatus Thermoplasmatota archaeon]
MDGTTAGNAPRSGDGSQTILLVDDEVDILESLRELFVGSLKNVHVRTARSGPSGLEILRTERVDLIVTDYKMPGMNGLQFLQEAQKIAPGVPRVLVTAFPDLSIAIQAINEASIENFITKPFESKQMIEVVRAVLLDRKTQQLWNESFARAVARR